VAALGDADIVSNMPVFGLIDNFIGGLVELVSSALGELDVLDDDIVLNIADGLALVLALGFEPHGVESLLNLNALSILGALGLTRCPVFELGLGAVLPGEVSAGGVHAETNPEFLVLGSSNSVEVLLQVLLLSGSVDGGKVSTDVLASALRVLEVAGCVQDLDVSLGRHDVLALGVVLADEGLLLLAVSIMPRVFVSPVEHTAVLFVVLRLTLVPVGVGHGSAVDVVPGFSLSILMETEPVAILASSLDHVVDLEISIRSVKRGQASALGCADILSNLPGLSLLNDFVGGVNLLVLSALGEVVRLDNNVFGDLANGALLAFALVLEPHGIETTFANHDAVTFIFGFTRSPVLVLGLSAVLPGGRCAGSVDAETNPHGGVESSRQHSVDGVFHGGLVIGALDIDEVSTLVLASTLGILEFTRGVEDLKVEANLLGDLGLVVNASGVVVADELAFLVASTIVPLLLVLPVHETTVLMVSLRLAIVPESEFSRCAINILPWVFSSVLVETEPVAPLVSSLGERVNLIVSFLVADGGQVTTLGDAEIFSELPLHLIVMNGVSGLDMLVSSALREHVHLDNDISADLADWEVLLPAAVIEPLQFSVPAEETAMSVLLVGLTRVPEEEIGGLSILPHPLVALALRLPETEPEHLLVSLQIWELGHDG